jgi:hypothetical protein
VPALGSLLLLGLASVLPFRFDLRSLQGLRRFEGVAVPASRSVLYLSSDNEFPAFEIAGFTLPYVTFPRGERRWLVLEESTRGTWNGGFLGVDAEGQFHAPETRRDRWSWIPASEPDWMREALRDWLVVYDSDQVREEFRRRLPGLAGAAHAIVLPPARRELIPIARSSSVLTFVRWLRIAALLGVITVACLISLGPRAGAAPWIGMGAAVWVAVWTTVGLTYLVDEVWPRAGGAVPFLLWAAGVALVHRTKGRVEWAGPAARDAWPLAALAMLYTVVMCARLDFDGDTYSTYLAVAKYDYWRGRHDPMEPGLLSLVQGSVYPPGYPLLLSLCFWALDLPRAEPLGLGAATSCSIFLYRLLVAAFNLACLLVVAAYAGARGGRTPLAAMAGVIGALLLVPSLRGQHTGAETVMVPLFATALVAILAGRTWDRPALCASGAFLAATMAFVKLDGIPYLLLLILPAAAEVGSRWGPRVWARVFASGLAGLVPFVVWRLSGPGGNPAFRWPEDPSAALRLIPGLFALALKLLLKSELWISLLLLFPVGVAWRLRREHEARAALVPAGVLLLSAGWIVLYCFSTLGAYAHMEMSFPRLMVPPALAALVYTIGAFSNLPSQS